MACLVCRGEKVGLSNRVSLAILRLVFRSSLSDPWILAFVNSLLKALAMSVSDEIVFHSNWIEWLPTTGLDPFRENTTFQSFLAFSSVVITSLEEFTPFISLVFRCLIEELGVQLGMSETRVLGRFHGLIVVATEISFSSKKVWLWRKTRGVMAVAPGGDVVVCCPQYQIPKEFLPGRNWRRKPRGKATRLSLLGKLPPISPEEVNESLFRRKVYDVF